MKKTTIATAAMLLTIAAQPLLADSPLMGKTFSAASKGQQPAANEQNTKGPLVTPAEPYGEDTPTDVLVKKALESSQATTVYNQQVEDVFAAIRGGGEVSLEDFRTSFIQALNDFFNF